MGLGNEVLLSFFLLWIWGDSREIQLVADAGRYVLYFGTHSFLGEGQTDFASTGSGPRSVSPRFDSSVCPQSPFFLTPPSSHSIREQARESSESINLDPKKWWENLGHKKPHRPLDGFFFPGIFSAFAKKSLFSLSLSRRIRLLGRSSSCPWNGYPGRFRLLLSFEKAVLLEYCHFSAASEAVGFPAGSMKWVFWRSPQLLQKVLLEMTRSWRQIHGSLQIHRCLHQQMIQASCHK